MATPQRAPRDILLDTDAEYQRLAEQHRQYDDDRADQGIGARAASSPSREKERPLHHPFVLLPGGHHFSSNRPSTYSSALMYSMARSKVMRSGASS